LIIHIGYFGKLPEFPDFIKHNSGQPETALFDDWIQKGLYTARLKLSSWKELYKNTPPYNFIVPIKESGRFLTGAIYFSCDKHNREFPFILFSVIDFNSIRLPFHLLPLFCKENFSFINNRNFNISDIKSSPDQLTIHKTEGYITDYYNEYSPGITTKDLLSDKMMLINLQQPLLFKLHSSLNILYISSIVHIYIKLKGLNNLPLIFWTEHEDQENNLFLFTRKSPSDFINLIDPLYGTITVISNNTDEPAEDNSLTSTF
jgi:type VI secretion system ImpM family protein